MNAYFLASPYVQRDSFGNQATVHLLHRLRYNPRIVHIYTIGMVRCRDDRLYAFCRGCPRQIHCIPPVLCSVIESRQDMGVYINHAFLPTSDKSVTRNRAPRRPVIHPILHHIHILKESLNDNRRLRPGRIVLRLQLRRCDALDQPRLN